MNCLVKGKLFVTGCGYFCDKYAYDDTWYMNKQWVWCHCVNPLKEHCENRFYDNKDIKHCGLKETTDKYDYELSVEKILDERDNERRAALNGFKNKYPHLKSCNKYSYDFKRKRIKANAYGISDCLNCVKCGFLKEADDNLYAICTDITVTVRFNRGDLFGEQEVIIKHERYKLVTRQRQNNEYNSYNQCLRYIKNSKFLYSDIENIIIKGIRWGTLLNCFLIPFKDDYFKSLGWESGEITVEHTEPYLLAKTERKTPQMALIAKAEKEAKKQHRLNIYRKRIRAYLNYKFTDDDSKAFIESRKRKLSILATKYRQIYDEELIKYNKVKNEKQAKQHYENMQLTL